MHVVCIRMLLSASICLSTLQKHEGGFVLILKSAWGVLSTLYFWAWGVLSAFKKTCGGFRPPITKWTWGVLSVGCFVLHSPIMPPRNTTKMQIHINNQPVNVFGFLRFTSFDF